MKSVTQIKSEKRGRIKKRIRSKVFGTATKPRLSVYRSNRNIYVQVIDDSTGTTIASVSDIKETKGTKRERAVIVGKTIAQLLKDKKISKVVFDRNGFKYTGRIEIVAQTARDGVLEF